MASFTRFGVPRSAGALADRASSSGSSKRVAFAPVARAHRLRTQVPCRAQSGPESHSHGRSPEDIRRELEASWAKQEGELARSSAGHLGPWMTWFGDTAHELPSPSATSSSDGDDYELIDGDLYTPFAGAGVTRARSLDGSVDEDIEFWSVSNPSSLIFGGAGLWGDLDQVYVILFGVGRSDTEGIYSLRALSRDDGLPQDTIIAFEDLVDAERYAGLLEATMDHTPSVCPIDPQELLEFCLESGYSCRLEANGSLLIPPDYNVGITDWERTLRLRDGQFSVMDGKDALGDLARHFQYAFPPFLPEGLYGQPDEAVDIDAELEARSVDELSTRLDEALRQESLDAIKRRLERLLPED